MLRLARVLYLFTWQLFDRFCVWVLFVMFFTDINDSVVFCYVKLRKILENLFLLYKKWLVYIIQYAYPELKTAVLKNVFLLSMGVRRGIFMSTRRVERNVNILYWHRLCHFLLCPFVLEKQFVFKYLKNGAIEL